MSYYKGTWNTSGSYKVTSQFSSAMTITFSGNEAVLTMGTGIDHGIFDIYIDGSLWEAFDGYAAAAGERVINIYLDKGGSHTIDIQNRAEKNKNSTGNILRFKQLVVLSTIYDQQTINYGYDALARLLTASYAGVSPTRSYAYAFDRNGNRTQQVVTVGGTPTTTNYTYNAVNQLTSGGATYDNNGNLTSDGTNSYTWDRANRLLSMGGASYKYDGLNNRVQQTVGANVTKYLLDLQPGLAVVLSETTGANVIRNVHSLRGIHAHKDAAGAWEWMVQDGLGSVRGVVDNSVVVQESRLYDPYGVFVPYGSGSTGSSQTNFGFTGEQTDGTGLVYLRNRYTSPALGQFISQDLLESLNRYAYASGNPINRVDRNGLQDTLADCYPAIGLDGTIVWICPEDGINFPPIVFPPGEITVPPGTFPPVVVTPGVQGETEQQKRERCRKNPDHEDCEKWWDENDPNACGCNSNFHPMSSMPFVPGLIGSAEEDALCNLNCYNGGIPYLFYKIGLSALGTGCQLIGGASTDVWGAFFEPYEDRTVAIATFGIEAQGVSTANRGGTIVVRQPGRQNRATRMATLVEEIAHASIFHEFFSPPLPPCSEITALQNEISAKLAKVLWMGISGIPMGIFQNTDLANFGSDVFGDSSNPYRKAFIRCNASEPPSSFQFASLGCIDEVVLQHLTQV